jgi:hypothetical protein
MRRLSRLYPRRWRKRYGAEFEALIEELPATPGNLLDVAFGAVRAHLAESRRYAATVLFFGMLFLITQMAQLLVLMLVSVVMTPPGHFPVFDLRIGRLDFYHADHQGRSFGVGLGAGSALLSVLLALGGAAYRARLAR